MRTSCARGLRRRAGIDDEDGPVGLAQPLLRGLLQELRRHLLELVEDAIDLLRGIVEERVGGEQIRLAESGESVELIVEAGADLHLGAGKRGGVDRGGAQLLDLSVGRGEDVVRRLVLVVEEIEVEQGGTLDVELVA